MLLCYLQFARQHFVSLVLFTRNAKNAFLFSVNKLKLLGDGGQVDGLCGAIGGC